MLQALLLSLSIQTAFAQSFIFPVVTCDSAAFCGNQIATQVEAHYQSFPKAPLEDIRERRFLVPQVYSTGHRTPFTFLFIHGLWDTGFQWDSVLLREYQQNSINLVLPGHGIDHVNGRATKWQ